MEEHIGHVDVVSTVWALVAALWPGLDVGSSGYMVDPILVMQ